MAKVEVWPTVHAERKALVDDLRGLDDARWDLPSLCDGWTVRDVLAHMTGTAKITTLSFFPKLVANGFSFKRLQAKAIAAERGGSPADTLARFEAEVTSTKHPPGPTDTWLGEVLIHAEDIRRPLAIQRAYPPEAAAQVADSYKGSNLVMGSKNRIAGLQLRATDTEWRHGEGPEVAGPMMSLLMAMAGRQAAIDDLAGDGVDTLRTRS